MIKRYIANITIEATTPLKVGSSAVSLMQDAPVQRDFNDLPMILGTSLAGVLRKEFDGNTSEIFGEEEGSKVIFSNALLVVDEKGSVLERLSAQKSEFLKLFETLPIREHTAIDDKGVAKDKSKFDEEVVYAGSRFSFLVEMLEDKEAFEKILSTISSPLFRLGGGTTKGFGSFKVTSIYTKEITSTKELLEYVPSINDKKGFTEYEPFVKSDKRYTKYTLKIAPEDFFIFGSGFGDDEADMTPVLESRIDYDKKALTKKEILIPASSLKGALAHRTAFYYNKLKGYFVGSEDAKTGEENEAVRAIFGHKKETTKDDKKVIGHKGRVLMSDCYKEYDQNDTKVFDHVAIDRFTGGAIDGALFQEKTIGKKDLWEIDIYLKEDEIVDETIKEAFRKTLKDVASGMLPLGGMTTKGHGAFIGEVLRDGSVI